jgi:hypothetical protein
MIYLASIVNANPTSPTSLIIKPNPPIPTFNLIINPGLNPNPPIPTFNLITNPRFNPNPLIPTFNLITNPRFNPVIKTNPTPNLINLPNNPSTESNIEPKLVEKSSIMQYNNKLVEEFDTLIVSNDAKNFKWQVLSEVVKNIMNDKETLDYMVKKHSDPFGFAYEQHYIQKKKAFSLFSSVHSSFCMSILMGKYH